MVTASALILVLVGRTILSDGPPFQWTDRIVRPTAVLIAQQAADPVLEQLDPPRRAVVIMALLALVLTGMFLVTFVMVGAHWVRRMARHKPSARGANKAEAAAQNSRLRDSLQIILPDSKTNDTVFLDITTKETKADG
jgi:di/tricarboxylate transporter